MLKVHRRFRIGKVQGYLRGRVWYLCYHESGQRRRPRVGESLLAARQLAAQINSQLENDHPTLLNFEPISIEQLRQNWLSHHEHVLRSSVHTIRRYRAATDHLLIFLKDHPIKLASLFTSRDAEAFVRHLRTVRVSPNGHENCAKRHLLDAGVKYVLECGRALFSYAAKRRHLSPYAQNPFVLIEVDRMPVENSKPIVLLTPEQEREFLLACDDWQFPVFLTLMLTGLRPGELCHLMVSDVDWETATLRIRNRPELGWQIKTRAERALPLVPLLVDVLKHHIGVRQTGSLFRQRRFESGSAFPPLAHLDDRQLVGEAAGRLTRQRNLLPESSDRAERLLMLGSIWKDLGFVKADLLRKEFIRVCSKIGLGQLSCVKLLRHQFATALQDANVDPLVRNLLMGHSRSTTGFFKGGLGMTAVYTHTRAETIRRQLELAMSARSLLSVAINKSIAMREAETAA